MHELIGVPEAHLSLNIPRQERRKVQHFAVEMKILVAVFLLCIDGEVSQGARILGMFPYSENSHFIMFEPIMKALATKGHDVTVVTRYPMKNVLANLKIINPSTTAPTPFVGSLPVDHVPGEMLNIVLVPRLAAMGVRTCEIILSSTPMQDLLQSNQKFDLVFYEIFNADCFLGFVHKFKAISIALSSSTFMPWATQRLGVPDNPAFVVNNFSGFSDKMTFWQRLWNTVQYGLSIVGFSLLADGQNYEIAKKYFGEDLPPLSEIAKNTSFYFVNTHFSLNQVRPVTPNIIEVGGVHIQSETKLSKDLQTFLDGSKEGVVYFSLGSTARGASLPAEERDAFIDNFRDLPQRVLWKWEDDILPKKPSNVMISKWTPQVAVLAHPNVKAFITHGGLLGTLEATHYGVPMISIPLFGDQFHNAAMCVKRGTAVKLSYNDISYESVKSALNTILRNNSYQEQAKIVSRAFQDRPQKPLDTVVYWTEYVLRHKGARYLQSQAVHLSLPQYILLDVFIVLCIAPVLTTIVLVLIIRCVCGRNRQSSGKMREHKQKHS